jgi:hypothetical protein
VRAAGLVFSLLSLLVRLICVILSVQGALVCLVGFVLGLLGLVLGLGCLVLRILRSGVCLAGLVLGLLSLVLGLGCLVGSLLRGLGCLAGVVLCLPGGVLSLLAEAARLLCLLTSGLSVVLGHFNPVADSLNVLTDVLARGQLDQRSGVLLAPALTLLVLRRALCGRA